MDVVITRSFEVDTVETINGKAKTTGKTRYEVGQTVSINEATWLNWSGAGLVRKAEKPSKKPFDETPTN